MFDEDITIRQFQHYAYCPHRWGMIEIDRAWQENEFVTRANIDHERVDSGTKYNKRNGSKVQTDVVIYNDDLGIYGVADCIEFMKDSSGKDIFGTGILYKPCVVEYKPNKSKGTGRDADLIQLFAQKLCAEFTFGTVCNTYMYYIHQNDREFIDFSGNYDEYYDKICMIIHEIREYMKIGTIPDAVLSDLCNGCSMKDMCMPRVVKEINAGYDFYGERG